MQAAQLKDILSYEADTHITEEDLRILQATFKDNNKLVDIIRKIFLPIVSDSSLPPEEMGNDIWLVGRNWEQIPNAEVKSIVLARQEAIKMILGGLVKIKSLANMKQETETEAAFRRSKDSTK